MDIVCDVCGKVCNQWVSTEIYDGKICDKCAFKMRGHLGKEIKMFGLKKELVQHILEQPSYGQYVRKKIYAGDPKHCIGCGKKSVTNFIDESHGLCQNCSMAIHTVTGQYNPSEKIDYKAHDIGWYQDELEECYVPSHNIIFNFKTRRVFIMDTLTKKNYKMVPFTDLVQYSVTSTAVDDRLVRHLTMDYKYNGSTLRYVADDSYEYQEARFGEFDVLVECLSKVEEIPQNAQNKQNASRVDGMQAQENIPNTNSQQAQANINSTGFRCPLCGGTNCTPLVENSTTGKDFSVSKGCCGAVLLGPIGILCGACGKGKQTTSTMYWVCPNCGNKFQA